MWTGTQPQIHADKRGSDQDDKKTKGRDFQIRGIRVNPRLKTL
jgi:hypothetical protein